MFADTITFTVNSVAKVLTRISSVGYTSEYLYRDSVEEFRFKIRQSTFTASKRGGRLVDKHNCELTQTIFPVSPATVNTVNKTFMVLENDQVDGATRPLNTHLAFVAWQTSANVQKLIAYES